MSFHYVWFIADGNYPAYTEFKDQPTVINELKRIIHLSTEQDHKVKITLATHKLDIERKRLVSKENDLTITILDRDQSSRIILSIKGRNNSGQKDPLRITSVFMGLLSVMSKDLSFEIIDIQYPCGCDKYLKWEHSLYSVFRSWGLEKISLTQDTINMIESFIDKLKTQEVNQIHYAIEKFMSSNSRRSPQDIILDLVISMEVLLGKGESIDSIKYRLCNRMMNCLSSDTQRRQELHANITKVYDIGSKIVHSSLENRKDKKQFDLCIKNFSYYRELIRIVFRIFIEHVNNKMTHKEILNRLDFDVRGITDSELSNIKWLE